VSSRSLKKGISNGMMQSIPLKDIESSLDKTRREIVIQTSQRGVVVLKKDRVI